MRRRRTPSKGFVAGEEMLALAATGERFGMRPSALLGISDPVLSLNFDVAAAARLAEMERRAAEEAGGRKVNRIDLYGV